MTTRQPGTAARTTTRVRLVEASDIVTTVPEGAPSRQWIDLRRSPDQIDLMDELRGRPALREQVELLNAPESPFITIACDCSTTRLFLHGGPPAWRTSSSVQFVCIDPARSGPDYYASLAQALLDGLGSDPHATRWNRVVELEPVMAVFHPDGSPAWSLSIRTHGYGLDSGTAVHEWSGCISLQTSATASWIRLNTPRRGHRVDSMSPRVHSQGPPRRIGLQKAIASATAAEHSIPRARAPSARRASSGGPR